jgi:hypothetical protein
MAGQQKACVAQLAIAAFVSYALMWYFYSLSLISSPFGYGAETYMLTHHRGQHPPQRQLHCWRPGSDWPLIATQCSTRASGKNRSTTELPPKLAVITSLVDSDESYLASFMDDVQAQTMTSWELFIASASSAVLGEVRTLLAARSPWCHVTILQLESDPGLYEIWDYVARLAETELLTNWNADDRKKPSALEVKALELDRRPEVAMVSSAILVNFGDVGDWASLSDSLTAWWAGKGDRADGWHLDLCDFVKLDEARHKALRTENLPHNSPMWRRSIHDNPMVGTFSGGWSGGAPTCADWALWVRVIFAGLRIWHVGYPLEIYLQRPSSHNRKHPERHERCVSFCLPVLEAQCYRPAGMSFTEWKENGRRSGKSVSLEPCTKCSGPQPRCSADPVQERDKDLGGRDATV